ncbi:MAG: ADP-forming succinate--CoA ligase subunit beta [Solirubrobacterales bacterium]
MPATLQAGFAARFVAGRPRSPPPENRELRAPISPEGHPNSISDRLPYRATGARRMDLLEYQGKQLFAKHGIPVPGGEVASTVEEAVAAAEKIGFPCAIKAQVLIGGRGKAGGIKIASDRAEAEQHADAILGMDIRGPHGEGPFKVHQVWVEGGSDIASEYYASVILDRSEKKLLAMVSAKGGMDIEAVAAEDPNALVKRHIDPTRPFDADTARPIADAAGLDEDVCDDVATVLADLAHVAMSEDATLIEVNPLIVTGERDVVALDAKVTIDNNSLYRHEDLAAIDAEAVEDPQEAMAREKGLTYVKLDGDVGILGNGAGLCMSTLDVVAQAGGAPANFLDAGGGSKAEAIVDALEVITSDSKVNAILFNIFGGITRCDEIAKGIVEASAQLSLDVPLVVRLDGTNSEEGLQILADANLPNLHQEKTMLGAAKRVVELAKEAAAA